MPQYCDHQTGYVLNASIDMYVYATIRPLDNGKIIFRAQDSGEYVEMTSSKELLYDGELDLLKAIYNRIVKDFTDSQLSFELTTWADAPAGSGLGSSSTLVVTVIKAFCEWLNIALSEYDIAHLAYEIERTDMKMAGGKQDQYAAAFGGFNFMEFHPENKVIVNPLKIKQDILNELEFNIILFYLGNSRVSSDIISAQADNIEKGQKDTLEAMGNLKNQSFLMKEALLKGEINKVGKLLDWGWQEKKKTSYIISNPEIDKIYEITLSAGATGGKISGAGGGGFFTIFCPGNSRYSVIRELKALNKEFRRFHFTNIGVQGWVVKDVLSPSPILAG